MDVQATWEFFTLLTIYFISTAVKVTSGEETEGWGGFLLLVTDCMQILPYPLPEWLGWLWCCCLAACVGACMSVWLCMHHCMCCPESQVMQGQRALTSFPALRGKGKRQFSKKRKYGKPVWKNPTVGKGTVALLQNPTNVMLKLRNDKVVYGCHILFVKFFSFS